MYPIFYIAYWIKNIGFDNIQRIDNTYSFRFSYHFYIEVYNVSNEIVIQKANTKLSVGLHRPQTHVKVVTFAMEE
jgi:hypothetical protein